MTPLLVASLAALLSSWSPGAFVVQGATVEVGDGTRLVEASVVVDEGAIVDVLPSSSPPPAGVRRVDGRGKVLTPGLVAVGSQVGPTTTTATTTAPPPPASSPATATTPTPSTSPWTARRA